MNTTAAHTLGRTVRRLLVVVATAVAALGLTLGTAAPSQAASPSLYSGLISANTYYGFVGGNAYIPYYGQDWLDFSLSFRDIRRDGFCTVVHARGVYQTGAVTGWSKVGSNCDTVNNVRGNASFTAASGYWFVNAQVRVCQSDRYGNVIGTCSNPISPYRWSLV